MRDARRHERIVYRRAIDLYCRTEQERRHGHSLNISCGGLFASGSFALSEGDTVCVEWTIQLDEPFSILGKVVRNTPQGMALSFSGNDAPTIDKLGEIIRPSWNGGFLLDGVVHMAPWYHDSDLASWMRLTTIMADWHRLKYGPPRH